MDRYAVIGNPIDHSLSPRIHELFALQTGEELRYERRLAPLDGFVESVESFVSEGGNGFNVTLPFKTEAHAWVDELDGEARAAGAVNTVHLIDGKSVGYNTDGIGLVQDLRNQGQRLDGKHILLLGSGGAVLGVVRRLLAEKPARLVIANRTSAKAQVLAAELSRELENASCDVSGIGLHEVVGSYDLVINGTSAGLQGIGDLVPPATVRRAFCYDLVYGKDTPFIMWARRAGVSRASDGLGMLVEQAAAAFYLWRGVRPDTSKVLTELMREQSRG